MFIWTISDLIGGIFALLLLAIIGVIWASIAWENFKRRHKREKLSG